VPAKRTSELLRLAWPASLSYILNNAYRINDQFWIQGLGDKAQAAIGATFFVQVLNFAVIFLAVGGTLALVSRYTGARDPETRDSITRHALVFGLFIGGGLMLCLPLVPRIVWCLGLRGESAALGEEYLRTIYLFMPSMALLPVVDSIFIARGNTRVPMMLQLCAVAMNYVLNPILIYGERASEVVRAPGVETISSIAGLLGIDGFGIHGAALATGVARTIVILAGLLILRFWMRAPVFKTIRFQRSHLVAIARISAPVCISIAVYALAYWGLLGLVLGERGEAVTAALGIGFQVFEGVAFPCYLGVSIAGSSLVGREIGARNRAGALEVVESARYVSRFLGAGFALIFWLGGRYLVPLFTQDEAVAEQTLLYVQVLAFSQYWVAVEAVNEKVLLGSGYTRPILWIGPVANILRLPLAYVSAIVLGVGAVGVWWAINVTTYLKAFLFWRRVEERKWLDHALRQMEKEGTQPR